MFPGPLRKSQRSEEGRLRGREKVKEEGGKAKEGGEKVKGEGGRGRPEGDLMMLDWTILSFEFNHFQWWLTIGLNWMI